VITYASLTEARLAQQWNEVDAPPFHPSLADAVREAVLRESNRISREMHNAKGVLKAILCDIIHNGTTVYPEDLVVERQPTPDHAFAPENVTIAPLYPPGGSLRLTELADYALARRPATMTFYVEFPASRQPCHSTARIVALVPAQERAAIVGAALADVSIPRDEDKARFAALEFLSVAAADVVSNGCRGLAVHYLLRLTVRKI